MTPALLEAIGVSKTFAPRERWGGGVRAAVAAVHEVTLALRTGETIGLVGESGCGKTTLAKLLVGLTAPSAGEGLMQGRPLRRLRGPELLKARRSVQMIFQDPMNSLNPRMTVEETLAEPLLIHRVAGDRRARIQALLESVRLSAAYRSRLPRELSGGERQRIGIARALAVEPDALLCDEPIASLDVSVGAQIVELLRALARERRMALLFISHDIRAVASLCERIVVMRQGRLVEDAPTDQLLAKPCDPYTALLLRSAALDLDAVPAL